MPHYPKKINMNRISASDVIELDGYIDLTLGTNL